MDIEELELIRKAQDGNMSAFSELIQGYERDIYNIAYRMMGNPHDSEDVAQEVCIKLYKYIKKYDGKSKFYTWIYKITVNTCIDEIRRTKKSKNDVSMNAMSEFDDSEVEQQFQDINEETPEQYYIKTEEKNEIQSMIDMLAPDQKAVVILRYINELEYEEIAESLGCNIGTVKSRLNRAKKKLLEIYNNDMEHNEKNIRLIKQEGGELYESQR